MIVFNPAIRPTPSSEARTIFIETFRAQIAALERNASAFRVPQTRHLYERHPGMAYHFKPELFIQRQGATDFSFPDRNFRLDAGEICIMPKGVPHGEVARSEGRTFENVVVCYYNETVAIHVAHADAGGRPFVDDIYFYTTPFFQDLVEYLNRICELRFTRTPACDTAIKGLMLAELALLQAIVEGSAAGRFSETERVFRCQWLIRNNIADCDLSVERLSGELHCSPNHLSKLFHEQTGERIVEYITRVRVGNALDALRHTSLSVKEIAAASGFNDPNYFARVFRKSTGRSPVEFRQDLARVACMREQEPKVVYYDREEHGFGLRPEVMARAESAL